MAEYSMMLMLVVMSLLIITSVNFIEGLNMRRNSTDEDSSLTVQSDAGASSSPLATHHNDVISSSSQDMEDNLSGKYLIS